MSGSMPWSVVTRVWGSVEGDVQGKYSHFLVHDDVG